MRRPNRYTVRWTEPAGHDLESILSYIARDHPTQATGILDRITGAAAALTRMPRRGRVVPELRAHSVMRYREIVVVPWRIVYEIAPPIVVVHAVLDARRSVEDLLLRRFVDRS